MNKLIITIIKDTSSAVLKIQTNFHNMDLTVTSHER